MPRFPTAKATLEISVYSKKGTGSPKPVKNATISVDGRDLPMKTDHSGKLVHSLYAGLYTIGARKQSYSQLQSILSAGGDEKLTFIFHKK